MDLLAVSTGVQIAYVVGIFAVVFGPVIVAEIKGNDILVGAGFFTLGITCWIAAFRLAHPESWWARRFYGPRKMARAEARWGEDELS